MRTPDQSYFIEAVRGRTDCKFHEDGRAWIHDYFNVRICATSLDDLKALRAVRYMGNEVELDWLAMVVRHAGHFDPLYVWEDRGRFCLEIEAYVDPQERAQPFVVLGLADRSAMARVDRCVDGPEAWGDMRSVYLGEDGSGWWVRAESLGGFEMVIQTLQDGVAKESRRHVGAGSHRLLVPASDSPYVGLSLSQDLAGGAEYENKHVFRGCLHN